MGLFNKKKNTEMSSSVLSESEIQKKLYGEFSDGISPVVTGGREQPKEPASPTFFSKESSAEKTDVSDLFSAQKDVLSEANYPPRQASPEQKPTDHTARYVPLRDFEKKPVYSSPVSFSSDSHARFRGDRPAGNKGGGFLALLKKFAETAGELFRFMRDPQQVALRRVFYWAAAILVVFLLFWGVNALNSQREDAMRARYRIPGEAVSVKTPEVVEAVVPAKPAVERPVVITPAPIRTAKTISEGTASKPALLAAESYVIQVVTYPAAQDANSIVKSLKSAGFRAFVKESARPSGRVFYMVLIGGFHTAADAQAQLLKFRGHEVARPFQDAFVRTNRS